MLLELVPSLGHLHVRLHPRAEHTNREFPHLLHPGSRVCSRVHCRRALQRSNQGERLLDAPVNSALSCSSLWQLRYPGLSLDKQTASRLGLNSRTCAEEKAVLFDHPEG